MNLENSKKKKNSIRKLVTTEDKCTTEPKHIMSVTDDLVQEINKPIYRFICKGTDKIKRFALINDMEDGGLKMLDIQSMVLARRVLILRDMWIISTKVLGK